MCMCMPSIYLAVSISLSVCVSIYLCTCLPTYLSIYPSAGICTCVNVFTCFSTCASTCLRVITTSAAWQAPFAGRNPISTPWLLNLTADKFQHGKRMMNGACPLLRLLDLGDDDFPTCWLLLLAAVGLTWGESPELKLFRCWRVCGDSRPGM